MKVCLVHNEYGTFSGEEAVIRDIRALLERHGHQVFFYTRSSAEIPEMWFGKARAFFSGVYSSSSRREMRRLIEEARPDLVQVQNLFPLISPSVLSECASASVPVVMGVQNYRLICPSGLHMVAGRVCERCRRGKEYWCVLKNCEEDFFKSAGYALRNYAARKWRMFLDNVTVYYALTEFQRKRLIAAGFPADRIVVVPNMAEAVDLPADVPLGEYVGYAGRVSPEKGVETLMAAAMKLPGVRFKAAGSYERLPYLPAQAPANFQFLGHLEGGALNDFYLCARIVVLASIWFETFGIVLAEGTMRAKPVVCSRIGGLAEIVDDGVTGLLFEPGNAEDLADKIRYLWERPALCREMGLAGREKALREYSPEKYYERLMAVYEKALCLGPGGPRTVASVGPEAE